MGVRGGPAVSKSSGEGKPFGFRVTSVEPDSPAAKAGIAKNDLILSAENRPVGSKNDFDTILSGVAPGKTIAIAVKEGSDSRKLAVKTAEPPAGLWSRVLKDDIGIQLAPSRGALRLTH